ncbi:S8 family serine peptidase [Mesobacillus thioparans]|uniref:S8 family serine peptidase n=1 Tax=Mesobacillus thioparans TaxID=370439 RepID=UPI0039F0777C
MKKTKFLSMSLVSMLTITSVFQASSSFGSAAEFKSQENVRKSQLESKVKLNNYNVSLPEENPLAQKLRNKKSKNDKQKVVPGELIIKYKEGATSQSIQSLYSKYSLKKGEQIKSIKSEVVKIPAGKKPEDYIKELKKDPAVEIVQPNFRYYSTGEVAAPNYYEQLWGLNNEGQSINGLQGVQDVDINAPESWSKFKNLKEVVVGVIDSGVDINHPDLKGKIWTNPGEIPGDGIDNDKNGYIDDVNGWDFYNNDNSVYDPLDGDEHGTHVSGTIAAAMEGSNISQNKGVVGVAPNVKIMPIKFLGPWGGDTAGAIAAIEYAKKMGVKLTNNSWGGGEYDPLLEEAIANCDCLFVAAAGNDGMNNDEGGFYPAGFETPNILSVAALTNQGQLAPFSNYGKYSVDVAAPGADIMSTIPKFPVDELKKMFGDFGPLVQINHPQYNFKAVVDGIGFEKITSEGRQDAFNTIMDDLISDKQAGKVLLVQDDEHDMANEFKNDPYLQKYFKDYLPVYEELLTNYNIKYDKITVHSSSTLPKSLGDVKLSDYQGIIWFTGHGLGINSPDWKTLTDEDVALLDSYLKTGGKMLLTGQDALWGIEDSPFVKSLLNLKVYPDMAPQMNVKGRNGSIFEGKQYTVKDDGALFPSADLLVANGSNTTLALDFVSDYSQAYAFYSGTSMAAPHAAGAAALFMGLNPEMPPIYTKLYLSYQGKQLPQLQGLVKSSKMVRSSNIDLFNEVDLPGLPLKKNIETGSLNSVSEKDKVFAVLLKEGQALNLSLTGQAGTDFDLYVFNEEAETVGNANGMVAFSENPGSSSEAIQFIAPMTGFYFIDVYAYKGKGDYKLAVGNFEGTYEDLSPVMEYSGMWDTAFEPEHSEFSASYLKSPGELNFSFVGFSFEWQGFKDITQGMADIYIDGVKEKSVSLYSSEFMPIQSIYKKELPYGKHTVKLVWTGISDPAARKSASGINVDRFIVKSNPVKPAVSYNTSKKLPVVTWSAVNWPGKVSYNVYRKEAAQSEFTQVGTVSTGFYEDKTAVSGKTYQYALAVVTNGEETPLSSRSESYKYDDDIKSSLAWKNSNQTGDLNVKTKDTHDVWKKQLKKGKTYEVLLTGPSDSDFNLSIFNPGTTSIYGGKAVATAASSKSSERIVFKAGSTGEYYFVPSAKSGSGQYRLTLNVQSIKKLESTSSSIKRSGKWSVKKYKKASGGAILYANKAKNSLKYTFTGTDVKVYGIKDQYSGYADIYLDGKKVKTVDLYAKKRQYKQSIYSVKNLANKKHTVTIVVKEKKRKASKGNYVKVDNFESAGFIPVK